MPTKLLLAPPDFQTFLQPYTEDYKTEERSSINPAIAAAVVAAAAAATSTTTATDGQAAKTPFKKNFTKAHIVNVETTLILNSCENMPTRCYRTHSSRFKHSFDQATA